MGADGNEVSRSLLLCFLFGYCNNLVASIQTSSIEFSIACLYTDEFYCHGDQFVARIMVGWACAYTLHKVSIDIVQRGIEEANNCPVVEFSAYKIIVETLVLLRLRDMFSQLRHVHASTGTLTIQREDSPKDCQMQFLPGSGCGNPE